jgi:hypothetical protein
MYVKLCLHSDENSLFLAFYVVSSIIVCLYLTVEIAFRTYTVAANVLNKQSSGHVAVGSPLDCGLGGEITTPRSKKWHVETLCCVIRVWELIFRPKGRT